MDETPSRAMDLTESAAWLNQAQVVESSLLAAAPAEVWESIASMPGVNAELMPVVRMTYPRPQRSRDELIPSLGWPSLQLFDPHG
jgi:hypothetical protein